MCLSQFGEKLLEELDYNQEARNIQARGHDAMGFTFCYISLKTDSASFADLAA